MMAITISNSISENPLRFRINICGALEFKLSPANCLVYSQTKGHRTDWTRPSLPLRLMSTISSGTGWMREGSLFAAGGELTKRVKYYAVLCPIIRTKRKTGASDCSDAPCLYYPGHLAPSQSHYSSGGMAFVQASPPPLGM